MTEVATLASLKTIFRFPFQDPSWKGRFMVGVALVFAGYFVPIVPLLFLYGYVLRVMRQALGEEGLSLPAWDDWGGLATDGLRVSVIGLVFFLPGLIVMFAGWVLNFAPVFSIPLMSTAEGASEEVLRALQLSMASSAIAMFSLLIAFGLYLAATIPLPVAIAHFVVQDKMSAAFHVREWWPLLRVNKLGYLIAWVVIIGLLGILYPVAIISMSTCVLCCLIPLLGAPFTLYVLLVGAALFGRTYQESVAMLETREAATLE